MSETDNIYRSILQAEMKKAETLLRMLYLMERVHEYMPEDRMSKEDIEKEIQDMTTIISNIKVQLLNLDIKEKIDNDPLPF